MNEQNTLARDTDEMKEEIARLLVQCDAQRNAIESLRAQRASLQSEIVRRLQLKRAEASPNASLTLNAAIGIVQTCFAQEEVKTK